MGRIAHVVIDSRAGYATNARAQRHQLVADEPTSRGGTDTGPTPHDLLLSAVGACTAITLRMYADRKSWTLGTITVDLELSTDEGGDRIRRVVSFSEPLDDQQRSKLAEIAEKTPVTKTVKAGVAISTEFAAGPLRAR